MKNIVFRFYLLMIIVVDVPVTNDCITSCTRFASVCESDVNCGRGHVCCRDRHKFNDIKCCVRSMEPWQGPAGRTVGPNVVKRAVRLFQVIDQNVKFLKKRSFVQIGDFFVNGQTISPWGSQYRAAPLQPPPGPWAFQARPLMYDQSPWFPPFRPLAAPDRVPAGFERQQPPQPLPPPPPPPLPTTVCPPKCVCPPGCICIPDKKLKCKEKCVQKCHKKAMKKCLRKIKKVAKCIKNCKKKKKKKKCKSKKKKHEKRSVQLLNSVKRYKLKLVRARTKSKLLKVCGIPANKMVDGLRTEEKTWPWLGVLFYDNKTMNRTVSLITHSFVVSSGIETKTNMAAYSILLGMYDRSDATPDRHLKVSELLLDDPLCLFRLTVPVKFSSNVRPVCLPFYLGLENESRVGGKGLVAGWDSHSKVGPHDAVPYETSLTIVTEKECQVPTLKEAECDVLCARHSVVPLEPCHGDLGGPLMVNSGHKWYMFGIVIKTFCGEAPVLAQRISSHRSWIQTVYEND